MSIERLQKKLENNLSKAPAARVEILFSQALEWLMPLQDFVRFHSGNHEVIVGGTPIKFSYNRGLVELISPLGKALTKGLPGPKEEWTCSVQLDEGPFVYFHSLDAEAFAEVVELLVFGNRTELV